MFAHLNDQLLPLLMLRIQCCFQEQSTKQECVEVCRISLHQPHCINNPSVLAWAHSHVWGVEEGCFVSARRLKRRRRTSSLFSSYTPKQSRVYIYTVYIYVYVCVWEQVFFELPEVRFIPACRYFITSEIPDFIFHVLAYIYRPWRRKDFRLLYLHRFPHGDSSQVGRYTCKSHPYSDKFLHRMCLDSLHIH